ncbi:hypothetical protein AOLI_G00237280 [Acnodon oligacanthus]
MTAQTVSFCTFPPRPVMNRGFFCDSAGRGSRTPRDPEGKTAPVASPQRLSDRPGAPSFYQDQAIPRLASRRHSVEASLGINSIDSCHLHSEPESTPKCLESNSPSSYKTVVVTVTFYENAWQRKDHWSKVSLLQCTNGEDASRACIQLTVGAKVDNAPGVALLRQGHGPERGLGHPVTLVLARTVDGRGIHVPQGLSISALNEVNTTNKSRHKRSLLRYTGVNSPRMNGEGVACQSVVCDG